MIVSHKYKFIYLKGHKVAGSSVLLAAGKYCGWRDMVHRPAQGNPPTDVWNDADWGKPRNTKGLKREVLPEQIIAKIGRHKWNKYFKFTVVRNPWDLLVSSFFWFEYTKTRQTEIKTINKEDFREYVLNPHKSVLDNHKRCFDDDGNPLLNFYIKFENLVKDYLIVCKKVGMPFVDIPRLKSNIRGTKQHYSSYYTDETREIVAQNFAREIEYFNYSFELK